MHNGTIVIQNVTVLKIWKWIEVVKICFIFIYFFFRRATSLDLPMAMRFRHLKKTSKEAVGVYR